MEGQTREGVYALRANCCTPTLRASKQTWSLALKKKVTRSDDSKL